MTWGKYRLKSHDVLGVIPRVRKSQRVDKALQQSDVIMSVKFRLIIPEEGWMVGWEMRVNLTETGMQVRTWWAVVYKNGKGPGPFCLRYSVMAIGLWMTLRFSSYFVLSKSSTVSTLSFYYFEKCNFEEKKKKKTLLSSLASKFLLVIYTKWMKNAVNKSMYKV